MAIPQLWMLAELSVRAQMGSDSCKKLLASVNGPGAGPGSAPIRPLQVVPLKPHAALGERGALARVRYCAV